MAKLGIVQTDIDTIAAYHDGIVEGNILERFLVYIPLNTGNIF